MKFKREHKVQDLVEAFSLEASTPSDIFKDKLHKKLINSWEDTKKKKSLLDFKRIGLIFALSSSFIIVFIAGLAELYHVQFWQEKLNGNEIIEKAYASNPNGIVSLGGVPVNTEDLEEVNYLSIKATHKKGKQDINCSIFESLEDPYSFVSLYKDEVNENFYVKSSTFDKDLEVKTYLNFNKFRIIGYSTGNDSSYKYELNEEEIKELENDIQSAFDTFDYATGLKEDENSESLGITQLKTEFEGEEDGYYILTLAITLPCDIRNEDGEKVNLKAKVFIENESFKIAKQEIFLNEITKENLLYSSKFESELKKASLEEIESEFKYELTYPVELKNREEMEEWLFQNRINF